MNFFYKLVQFAAIILVSTSICAGLFALSDYVSQYRHDDGTDRERARERVKADSVAAMKERAFWGGVLGAVGSGLYVLRCLTRNEEP